MEFWWYHENANCRESLNPKGSGIFSYIFLFLPTGIGSCRWAGLADWQERVAGLPSWTALFLYFCKCAEQDHTRRYGCFLRLHRAA